MSKKISLLVIIFLTISGCQKKEEIKVGTYIGPTPYEIAMDYCEEQDYENALYTYEKILNDIESQMNGKEIDAFWVKGMIGRMYIEMGEPDLAKPYIEEGVDGYRRSGETGEDYSFICQTEGLYFKMTEQYDKAIQSFEESIKYMDPQNDHSVRSYVEMGLCYEKKCEEKAQIECYEKALKYGKESGNYTDLYQVYIVWGIYYAERGNTDKSEELFEKSLECAQKAWGEESSGVADAYQKLASNSNLKGQYKEAIQYSEKALNIFTNLDGHFERDIASIYNNLGYLNMKLDDNITALAMMRKSYNVVKENEKNKNVSEFYENALSVNIKSLYQKSVNGEIGYDEWFEQNFESYVEDTE